MVDIMVKNEDGLTVLQVAAMGNIHQLTKNKYSQVQNYIILFEKGIFLILFCRRKISAKNSFNTIKL
jgi:hypothetical protein